MSRILITGAGGFVGSHVLSAYRNNNFRSGTPVPLPKSCDITKLTEVRAYLKSESFDHVLHLASQSFVPESFRDPGATYDVNVMGTLNLLEGLKEIGFRGKFVYVSSGDIYGKVPEELLPINESTPRRPGNPYASSKVAAEELCLQWHRSEGLAVTIARPFNHIGPGQSDRFVVASIAKQLALISKGAQQPRIEVGDIDVSRDFTDVRDVVTAYDCLLSRGISGNTYIISSGIERTIRSMIEQLVDISGLKVELMQDQKRLRPADQRRVVADASLLRNDTDWAPVVPMHRTLLETFEYFKEMV